MNLESLTADQILSIKLPSRLFQADNLKEQLQKLNRIWHPDLNHSPKASEVMAHINVLYRRAEVGDWGNVFQFEDLNTSKKYSFKYKKSRLIDVGEMYIGEKMVVFNVRKSEVDLAKVGFDSIRSIKYPTRMLEENFKRFIPRDVKLFTTDSGVVVSMYKGPDQICLLDIIESGFSFQPGHISWIVTGLYNFILFMQQSQNKMFGGLGVDSIFVNTKMRGVHILGGWGYSAILEKPICALPEWLFHLLPESIINRKKADFSIDLIALKAIAIHLLGDESMVGSRLSTVLDPKHMRVGITNLIQFLRSPVDSTTIKEYQRWLSIEKDLSRLDIPVTFNDIYNEDSGGT